MKILKEPKTEMSINILTDWKTFAAMLQYGGTIMPVTTLVCGLPRVY